MSAAGNDSATLAALRAQTRAAIEASRRDAAARAARLRGELAGLEEGIAWCDAMLEADSARQKTAPRPGAIPEGAVIPISAARG